MACGIYKITNIINKKIYIGQSINIQKRWNKEKSSAYNINDDSYNTLLSKAFRKYGIDNFIFEIIEECPKELLDEKEKYYITYFDSYNNGYNATTGGQGTQNVSIKISSEDLDKIYDLLQNTTISQREIAQQFNVGEDVISTINHGKSRRQEGYNYPLRKNYNKHICIDCGKEIDYKSIRCDKCYKIYSRKVKWPLKEELKDMILTQPFTQIAKKYGVTDNAVRKWCKYYSLPYRKKDINNYTKEEWEKL